MQKIIRRTVSEASFDDDLHPLLRRIFASRGVTSSADLEHEIAGLESFSLLSQIDVAVQHLLMALETGQRILVVSDFDADGATGAALMVRVLRAFGASEVDYLVPNRFEFGYGLTPEIVEVALERDPELIITVDNGICSIEGVKRAKELGIKVVITDHHLPGNQLPEAAAIVNPNQSGDKFPSKALAGVGVVFYLMLALRKALRDRDWFEDMGLSEPNMAQYLDLVALGTVADVVSLDKNNRILVHQGLRRIRVGKACVGILALIKVAGNRRCSMVARDLGFALGPRLNAAGRLSDMGLGIELLLTDDFSKAHQIAMQLDLLNKERRAIEDEMRIKALGILDKLQLANDLPRGVCLYDANWHQGVIGILASRLKDKLFRPVIVFAKADGGLLKGSARSVSRVHIRDVLGGIDSSYPNLMLRFGGHAMAAGLSIAEQDYSRFCEIFAAEISKCLPDSELCGYIYTDGELDAEYFNLETAELLRNAAPWGQHFPEPLFDGEFKILQQRIIGDKHLKFILGLPDTTKTVEAVVFNVDLNVWPNYRCDKVRAVYRFDVNEFRWQKSPQLIVEYLEALPA